MAECSFIEGEPRAAKFCGAVTKPGSSYCAAHHARCYSTAKLKRLQLPADDDVIDLRRVRGAVRKLRHARRLSRSELASIGFRPGRIKSED